MNAIHESLSRPEFARLLNERGGACPVTILTHTEPKLLKTGNPFSTVVRVTRRNGFIGGSYENIVNNAQEKQGGERDFEAESLPWGQHAGRFFITHKDNLYLKFFHQHGGVEGVDKWIADGVEVPVEQVQKFLPKHKDGEAGVAWRAIKLSNILEVVIDGKTIDLTDEKAAA